MKNEIKEILDDLKTYKDRYEYFLFNNLSFSDRDYKAKILLDYITNLEQEKQEMKDGWQQEVYDKDKILNKWLDLRVRIDKAIECMKSNSKINLEDGTSIVRFYKDLLNILTGESDE